MRILFLSSFVLPAFSALGCAASGASPPQSATPAGPRVAIVDVATCADPTALEHPDDPHALVSYDARGNIAQVTFDRPLRPGQSFALCTGR